MSIDKIFQTRKENFLELVKKAGGNAAFSREHPMLQWSPDYIAQLCRGYDPKKKSGRNINDDTAQKICEALELPEGFLDRKKTDTDSKDEVKSNTNSILAELAHETHQIRALLMIVLEFCAESTPTARQEILYRLRRLSAHRKHNAFLLTAASYLEAVDDDLHAKAPHKHLQLVKNRGADQGN